MISIVAAVDKEWAIGKDGGMLYHLPADLTHFRELTEGKTVFMGRKTLESLPNKAPLPNRRNIVLTKNQALGVSGLEIAHSFAELFSLISREEQVFNIGGTTVYKALLDCCKCAYITKIEEVSLHPDSYFPNLDENSNWKLKKQSDKIVELGITYSFLEYENLNVKDPFTIW